MKSFFKKLSLVLVAAMILTLIPAQNAKAAGTVKLALQAAKSSDECITSYTIKKGDTVDFKFFGCADYKTTGIAWKSSNDAVATVDKNGVVTAVAAGAAQITYEATGYVCEPVTVVVADEYTVFIAKQDGTDALPTYTMNVKDAAVDFRFIGAKGWSTSKNGGYWTSTNEAVATVDKNGVVTPVSKGETDIVLTIIDKATGKVAFNVQPMHVTVKAEQLEVSQYSYEEAKVTFNGKAVAADDLEVYLVGWDENKEEQLIKEYVESVNGEIVKLYNDIVNGQKYAFVVNGEKAYLTGNAGDCATFDVTWSSKLLGKGATASVAYADQDLTFKVDNFRDANGVIIDSSNYTWEYVDTCTINGEETVTQYYMNDQLFVPAKSHHVVEFIAYNAENVKACTVTKEFDAVDAGAWAIDKVSWAIGDATTPLYFDKCGTSTKLSIDDDDKYGFAVKFEDTFGNIYKSYAGDCDFIEITNEPIGDVKSIIQEYGQITFESSNPNVVAVKDNGTLEIIKENSKATIFCYFQALEDGDGKLQPRKLLFAVTIETIGHLVPTSVTMTVNGDNVTRYYLNEEAGACEFNKATVAFEVKDQLGRAMDGVDVSFVAYDQNKTGVNLVTSAGDYETSFTDRFQANATLTFATDNKTVKAASTVGGKTSFVLLADAIDGAFAKGGILNTRLDITLKNNFGSTKKTLNIGTFDTSEMAATYLKDEPAIYWTTCNDAKAAHTLIGSGLGNSDNAGADGELYLALHIVDVYAASGARVYGKAYTRQPVELYGNDNIANKTASQLASFEGKTFVQFEATNLPDNTLTAVADAEYVHNGIYYVKVRNAFAAMSDKATDDKYSEYEYDAMALAAIKDLTIDAKIWQVVNSTSNTSHATLNKRVMTTYDAAEKRTYKNNDAANYNVKLNFADLYYVGDSPEYTGWSSWLKDHAKVTICWNNNDILPLIEAKGGKANSAISATEVAWSDSILTKYVVDAKDNSKYIRNVEFFFDYDDGTAVLTYAKVAVGKTVRPWTYEYKYEVDWSGNDTEGR